MKGLIKVHTHKRLGVLARQFLTGCTGPCWDFQGCFYDFRDSLTCILPHPPENMPMKTRLIIYVTFENSSYKSINV